MQTLVRFQLAIIIAFTLNIVAHASTNTVNSSWIAVSPIIAKASYETGIDVKLLAAMGAIESSFKPLAKNKHSSARGIYQFTKRTWNVTLAAYGHLYGLTSAADIHDPYANAVMAAEYIKENIHVMYNKLYRLPTYEEIYMAHLVSPLRAVAIANMPEDHIVADSYPSLAKVNKRLFYDDNGDGLTAKKFKALISAKVNKALHVYGKLANVALIKYQDGQLQLDKLAESNLEYDFETCVRKPTSNNPAVEIHFIGYDDTAEIKRCPTKPTASSNLNLLYIPNREYDTI